MRALVESTTRAALASLVRSVSCFMKPLPHGLSAPAGSDTVSTCTCTTRFYVGPSSLDLVLKLIFVHAFSPDLMSGGADTGQTALHIWYPGPLPKPVKILPQPLYECLIDGSGAIEEPHTSFCQQRYSQAPGRQQSKGNVIVLREQWRKRA